MRSDRRRCLKTWVDSHPDYVVNRRGGHIFQTLWSVQPSHCRCSEKNHFRQSASAPLRTFHLSFSPAAYYQGGPIFDSATKPALTLPLNTTPILEVDIRNDLGSQGVIIREGRLQVEELGKSFLTVGECEKSDRAPSEY